MATPTLYWPILIASSGNFQKLFPLIKLPLICPRLQLMPICDSVACYLRWVCMMRHLILPKKQLSFVVIHRKSITRWAMSIWLKVNSMMRLMCTGGRFSCGQLIQQWSLIWVRLFWVRVIPLRRVKCIWQLPKQILRTKECLAISFIVQVLIQHALPTAI